MNEKRLTILRNYLRRLSRVPEVNRITAYLNWERP